MFDQELNERIKTIYADEPEVAIKIINGDIDSIQEMTLYTDFTPETIIYCIENNKTDELYTQAKKQVELKKLYHDICSAYTDSKTKPDQTRI